MSAAARRRRAALIVLAVFAVIAGAIVGGAADDDAPPEDEAPAVEPVVATCPEETSADDRRLAGGMLVVRMEATATQGLRRSVRRGEIAGVVLFPPEGTDPKTLGTQIERLHRAAHRGGAPPPVVAIDQEGGEVERLPGLAPARRPAAIRQPEVARSEGANTGKDLAAIGINVDLAPVLDIALLADSIITSRAFGSDVDSVVASGVAFGEAMQAAGVAATAKHFPGLGLATVNTDDAPTAIEASRRELAGGLEPFAAAVDAGFGLVMVANATYPAYDAERPASLSPRLIDGVLRRRLGYDGVVITDDLGAGAITGAGIAEGEAAVGAARAGADLLLFALSDGAAAREALVSALENGPLDRETALASCARTTALREGLSAPVP